MHPPHEIIDLQTIVTDQLEGKPQMARVAQGARSVMNFQCSISQDIFESETRR